MAWLAVESGQPVADLLAIPATVYTALRTEVITRIRAERERLAELEMVAARNALMGNLRQQMGR